MAIDIFLTIPGVPGESQDTTFQGAIELTSYSWGLSKLVTIGSGTGGTGTGKTQFSELNITKDFDKSSPLLMQALESGKPYPKITLSLRRTAGGSAAKAQVFLTYEFDQVYVTSISDAASSGGGDAPSESISFTMGAVAVEYYPQNNDGSLGTGVTSSWSVVTNSQT